MLNTASPSAMNEANTENQCKVLTTKTYKKLYHDLCLCLLTQTQYPYISSEGQRINIVVVKANYPAKFPYAKMPHNTPISNLGYMWTVAPERKHFTRANIFIIIMNDIEIKCCGFGVTFINLLLGDASGNIICKTAAVCPGHEGLVCEFMQT